jgi:RNA polymerase sigma-70 factor (ECF subfamily)
MQTNPETTANRAGTAGAGGATSTETLYRDYAGKVSRWATALTRSASDADDLVQEVFLVAHRRLPELGTVEHPGPWLLQMTRNLAQHLWRSRGRSAKRAASWETHCRPSAPRNPEELLEIRRAAEQVESAVASLDERYREIYWLCEVKELPSARVAALTGLNPDTLRVRRFRARQQVTKRLALVEQERKAA